MHLSGHCDGKTVKFTPEQNAALDRLASTTGLVSLTGPAGTGKTTIVRELKADLYLAMTGKAAVRLREVTGQPTATLHSALYGRPETHELGQPVFKLKPSSYVDDSKRVVLDEASMLSPHVLRDIRIAWPNRTVIFVGDPYQLPPILSDAEREEMKLAAENAAYLRSRGIDEPVQPAGGPTAGTHAPSSYGSQRSVRDPQLWDDFSVFAEVDGPRLTEVMRATGGIVRAAERLRNDGKLSDTDDNYELLRSDDPACDALTSWLDDQDDHVLITWRNATRMHANAALRDVLGRKGLLEPGEPIVVYQNSQAYDVLNGDIYTVASIEDGPRIGPLETVWVRTRGAATARPRHGIEGFYDGTRDILTFRDGKTWALDGERPWIGGRNGRPGRYGDFTYRDYMEELIRMVHNKTIPEAPVPISYAYVLTAHKAQGSEYRRATVFLERDDLQHPRWEKPTRVPGHEGSVCQSVRWLYTATTRGKAKVTAVMRREPPPLLRRLAGPKKQPQEL